MRRLLGVAMMVCGALALLFVIWVAVWSRSMVAVGIASDVRWALVAVAGAGAVLAIAGWRLAANSATSYHR